MNKVKIIFLSLACLVFGLSFSFVIAASEQTGTLNPNLQTGIDGVLKSSPVVSPAANTYTSAQNVSLTANGSTAICYTTNNLTPSCQTPTSCASGTKYISTISVSSSLTIKSVACYADDSEGPIGSAQYIINIPSASGSSGGGGAAVSYCNSVEYGPWQACIGGLQTRSIFSSLPSGCTLTTAQQLAASRACTIDIIDEQEGGLDGDSSEEPTTTPPVITPPSVSPVNVAAIMAAERALVTRVNTALTNRLAGRILLQVEEKGQDWYIEPVSKQKHFMGRPADAFDMMRRFGLGISEANFSKFEKSGVPARFAGRIFLRVESKGEAYYINPVDMKMYYLGRPVDAFNLMRSKALGISNLNIRQIPVGEVK